MPRRLPVRPSKIIGNIFVFIVLSYIFTMYYFFVFELWGPRLKTSEFAQIILVFFHVLVFMLLWSFIQAMFTDPGQVPVFWGFHQGDPESKRRRYCLMCNVFKPERCHHCSACNRCVLNMDHHCPWINNCIGFWNRKHFLLLLIYVLLTSYFTAVTMIIPFSDYLMEEYGSFMQGQWNWSECWEIFAIIFVYVLDICIAFLISAFLKFHIKIASENKTTIETLENKNKLFVSRFDNGVVFNWQQIFGNNKFLWPFPIYFDSGKPLGDGVYWIYQVNNTERRLSNATDSSSTPQKQNAKYQKFVDQQEQQQEKAKHLDMQDTKQILDAYQIKDQEKKNDKNNVITINENEREEGKQHLKQVVKNGNQAQANQQKQKGIRIRKDLQQNVGANQVKQK